MLKGRVEKRSDRKAVRLGNLTKVFGGLGPPSSPPGEVFVPTDGPTRPLWHVILVRVSHPAGRSTVGPTMPCAPKPIVPKRCFKGARHFF